MRTHQLAIQICARGLRAKYFRRGPVSTCNNLCCCSLIPFETLGTGNNSRNQLPEPEVSVTIIFQDLVVFQDLALTHIYHMCFVYLLTRSMWSLSDVTMMRPQNGVALCQHTKTKTKTKTFY